MRYVAPQVLIAALLSALLGVLCLALTLGTVELSVGDLWRTLIGQAQGPRADNFHTIVFDIRLPRILLALCIGAILALSGAVMQGLFRNPLADPSLIGVSSGASVGASLAIVFSAGLLQTNAWIGLSVVAFGAFAGGLLATLLVYRLATSEFGTSVTTMLLAGIAIGAIAGSLNGLLSYFSNDALLRQMSIWQMGNLSTANWSRLLPVAVALCVLLVALPRVGLALNALLLGESEARHLGINVQRVKRQLIVATALGIGMAVAVAGLIGFVGLVVPHLIRLLIGPDHRWLMPASALGGAMLLIIADTLARVVASPAELPIGILTALIGAPLFIGLLVRQRRELQLW
jgi:iron complex transport system permease protein